MWSATEEEKQQMARLRAEGKTVKEIADIMGKRYWQVAHKIKDIAPVNRAEEVVKEILHNEEELEILSNGSHKSKKLLQMDEKQKKDPSYLLHAHGYDPNEWELVNSKHNIWNTNDKKQGVQTLYSSRITAKPKEKHIDHHDFIEKITKTRPAKRIEFKGIIPEEKTYLFLPLFDLHFGPSTLEHYQDTLRDIVSLLEKSYNEVLIILGQDMLHNDDFRGRTSSGREIEKVNMIKAWKDADAFFTTIIETALEKSDKVSVIYSKGNHDESMSWAFTCMMEKAYGKQAYFDIDFKERKVHMLGTNFIGITHGEKNRKNVASNFSVEFPDLWAVSTQREVFVGHLHRKRVTQQPTELVIDDKGVIVREMGSGCVTDQYHDDYGYTLAHKEFEVYEYSANRKKRIHYV